MTNGMKLRRVTMPEAREMRRLYERENLTIEEVAERLDRATDTVRRVLRLQDVQIRPVGALRRRHPRCLPNEAFAETVALYQSGLSLREVAARLEIKSESTVRYRLRCAGVQTRDISEGQYLSQSKNRLDPTLEAQVIELYQAGLKQREVAERVGIHMGTVRATLRRNRIPVRQVGKAPLVYEWPPPKEEEPSPTPGGGYVPSQPLVDLIVGEIQRRYDTGTDRNGKTRGDVCDMAGVDVRDLYAWQHGERPNAHLDKAERVLIAFDKAWEDVYQPEDLPEWLR